MLVPVLGLLMGYTGYALFAVVGVFLLRFVPGPGLRLATFMAFMFSALAFHYSSAFLYIHLLEFRSTGSDTAFLVAIPMFAVLVGWVGASVAARLLKKPRA